MENAVEALIMAGSIFLLIIALTLGISSFSRVKTQIDDMVLSREKVEYAVDSKEGTLLNFIQSDKNKYTRTVSIETIVTTLRRIRKESFDVYIVLTDDAEVVNKFAEELRMNLRNNNNTSFDDIDVSHVENALRFSISGAANKYVEDKNSDKFDETINLLYNKVGTKNFKEYYGIYKEKTEEGVADVEKSDRKIITYVEIKE